MQSDIMFDNLIIADDQSIVDQWTVQTYAFLVFMLATAYITARVIPATAYITDRVIPSCPTISYHVIPSNQTTSSFTAFNFYHKQL